MRRAIVSTIVLILGLISTGIAQNFDDKLWIRVELPPGESIQDAQFSDYHRFSFEGQPGNVIDLIVADEDYSFLRNAGYLIEIISEDYTQTMRELSDRYYTFNEAVNYMDSLAAVYPDLMKIDSIGTTHEGRAIWCVKISENVEFDDPEKAGALYIGLHHANELATVDVILTLMDYFLTEYSVENNEIMELLSTRQLWFIPVFNPDGLEYVHAAQDIGWRKNRRSNGDGSYGVDLNRNYGYMWGYDNSGSSGNPSAWNYRGPEAFSEPETQAMRNFFEGPGSENRKITAALTYHMKYNESVLLHPWYYMDTVTPDHEIFAFLCDSITAWTDYSYGTLYQTMGYFANGSLDEWMYADTLLKDRIFTMTVEFGLGEYNFDTFPISSFCELHIEPNLFLAEYADRVNAFADINNRLGEVYLSSSYVEPGVDSLIMQVSVAGGTTQFGVFAHIDSLDGGSIEVLQLYDDGMHSDGLEGDSLYGNTWPVLSSLETYCEVAIEGMLFDEDSTGFTLGGTPFTSIGPLSFQNLSFYGDSTNYPGDNPRLYIDVLNESDSVVVNDVAVSVWLDDETFAHFFGSTKSYGDIEAGATATNSSYFRLYTDDDCPGDTNITVNMVISSADIDYWEDSFVIYIQPDTTVGIVEDDPAIPQNYSLSRNYPNPFNPTTTISYDLPEQSIVNLTIFDIRGQEVITLLSADKPAGNYEVRWNGMNAAGNQVSTGVYFARLQAGSFNQTIKMVYLR